VEFEKPITYRFRQGNTYFTELQFQSLYQSLHETQNNNPKMKTQELQHSIEIFDFQRQKDVEYFQNLIKLQQTFVKDFPISIIKDLMIDEYIEGKGSRTSFCYRLERQLGIIGNMRGSTSAVFVVYFGKKGKERDSKFRFTNKIGHVNNEFEALEKVKSEIIDLINAGKTNDINAILKNRLADLFKYKILGTYYPSKYLNQYSSRHLNYFLSEIGLNPSGETVLDKQNTLLEFKNSDEIMNKWSNFEFNRFLYGTFGRPPSNDDQEMKQGFLPAIEKVNPEFVDLTIIEEPFRPNTKNKSGGKPDYIENQERNNRLGKRGENIVYNLEKDFLIKKGLPTKKLIHVSLKNDRLGFDIQSLDEEGNIKYIEVKTTRRKKGDTSFIITDNEKETAESLKNYYIYIVFEGHTTKPKIWRIREPFNVYRKKLKLFPINYKVVINVKE
jgi:hypothetical protein